MLHNPEYRLKARSGSDRSVKGKIYARTTDKGSPNGRIYSLLSRYNKSKRELTYGMEDSYAPSGYMVFHNCKFINLYSHKERKFPGEFKDFEEFFDQDAMIAKLQWLGEMICSAPRYQAAMTALS